MLSVFHRMRIILLHVESEPNIQLNFSDENSDPQIGDHVTITRQGGKVEDVEIVGRKWIPTPGGQVVLHITAK